MNDKETLGDLIAKMEAVLNADVPVIRHPNYAELFRDTTIERVIFEGDSFVEAASEYCLNEGWREPD